MSTCSLLILIIVVAAAAAAVLACSDQRKGVLALLAGINKSLSLERGRGRRYGLVGKHAL